MKRRVKARKQVSKAKPSSGLIARAGRKIFDTATGMATRSVLNAAAPAVYPLLGMAAQAAAPYAAGGAYGAYSGLKYAAKAARYAGDLIAGRGAYYSRGRRLDMGQSVPTMVGGSSTKYGNSVCITHKEFIADVSGSTAFTNAVYPINPGLESTFPWLSEVAKNFEEYDFEALAFVFNSTSADALNSTNTALGTVIGAVQYNGINAPFGSKQEMENYEFARSGKPSSSNMYFVECAPGENPLDHYYIRTGAVPSGADQRLYDVGDFQIATTGMQAAAVIGELWVTYKIHLYKPRMALPGAGILTSHWQLPAASVATTNAYFGSSPSTLVPQPGSNLNCVLGADTITFPATVQDGNFMVIYQVKGSSTVLTNALALTATSGCLGLKLFDLSTNAFYGTTAGATATRQMAVACYNISAPSAVVTFSAGTMPTSITAADLIITELNSEVLTLFEQAEERGIIVRTDKTDMKKWTAERAHIAKEEKEREEVADDVIIKNLARLLRQPMQQDSYEHKREVEPDDEYVRPPSPTPSLASVKSAKVVRRAA